MQDGIINFIQELLTERKQLTKDNKRIKLKLAENEDYNLKMLNIKQEKLELLQLKVEMLQTTICSLNDTLDQKNEKIANLKQKLKQIVRMLLKTPPTSSTRQTKPGKMFARVDTAQSQSTLKFVTDADSSLIAQQPSTEESSRNQKGFGAGPGSWALQKTVKNVMGRPKLRPSYYVKNEEGLIQRKSVPLQDDKKKRSSFVTQAAKSQSSYFEVGAGHGESKNLSLNRRKNRSSETTVNRNRSFEDKIQKIAKTGNFPGLSRIISQVVESRLAIKKQNYQSRIEELSSGEEAGNSKREGREGESDLDDGNSVKESFKRLLRSYDKYSLRRIIDKFNAIEGLEKFKKGRLSYN